MGILRGVPLTLPRRTSPMTPKRDKNNRRQGVVAISPNLHRNGVVGFI
jgi:hypothetical protein